MNDFKENKIETCNFCGLTHRSVEMNGISHCPNRACTGSGAAWFRRTLKSYKEKSDGTHTVDPEELKKVILENPWEILSNILEDVEKRSLENWKKEPEKPKLREVGILSDGTPMYSKDNGAGGEFYLDCDGAIIFNENDGIEKLSMVLFDIVRKRREK